MGDIAEQSIEYYEYVGRGHSKTFRSIKDRPRGKRFKLKTFTTRQQVKGVMFFLYDKGYFSPQDAHDVIRSYCKFAGIQLPEKKPIIYACCEIQKNFSIFLKWFNANCIK